MGRPRKHENEAAKQAAFRQRWAVKSLRLTPGVAQTIEELAAMFDTSESDVAHRLFTFALLNRNWKTMGLTGKPLPSYQEK